VGLRRRLPGGHRSGIIETQAREEEFVPRQVELLLVEPLHIAVVRDRVAPGDLARFVRAACGEVWTFVREAGLPTPGRNLALHLDAAGSVECGVEVSAPFPGNGRILCSQTPGGRVATAAHFGPYKLLSETHRAIRKWCADHGHELSGVSWEVYGHWKESWNSDPSQIRTDVYYEIREKTG
jgi:effector-binding domain-containing protein